MKKQSGMSMYMVIYVALTLGFAGFIGLRIFTPYLEYFSVKKVIASMALEEAKSAESVKEIRQGFDRRASIAYITAVKGEDLEITKEGGETVVAASWTVKVPLVAQASLVLDFTASTK